VRYECSPAGCVEENLRRALLIARGDPTVFIARPISAGFLAATVLLLVMVVPAVWSKRKEALGAEARE
jgi:putative tricarboxylic transport membrane protein